MQTFHLSVDFYVYITKHDSFSQGYRCPIYCQLIQSNNLLSLSLNKTENYMELTIKLDKSRAGYVFIPTGFDIESHFIFKNAIAYVICRRLNSGVAPPFV